MPATSKSPMGAACAAILAALVPAFPAAAVDFNLGGFDVRFDTTLSAGLGMRVEQRDPRLIGVINGGTAFSINGDNGNLNFDKGDLTSANVRALHELSARYGDELELFTRFTYFYDFVNGQGSLARTTLTETAKRRAGRRFELLDLYGAYNFDIGRQSAKIRLGQQVISWGESTFIQNGINIINPVDVTKLRTAGAELREAVLPVPAAQFSVGLTDNVSLEAFYQATWRKTHLEAEGTYFATTDFAGPGGRYVFLRFGLPPGPRDNPVGGGVPPVGSIVNRLQDRDADDKGQFGVALRALVPSLASTEFGAYFIQYNSRTPIISARTGTLGGLLNGNYAGGAAYFLEYPDKIKMVGGSFNTNIAEIAIQGEFSHHWDQPLQVDDVELLFAALSPLDPFLGLPLPPGTQVFGRSQLGPQGFNREINGYRRKTYDQFQFTLTKAVPRVLHMDQLVLIAEAGFTWVNGMEDKSVLRYEGPGTFTSGNSFFTTLGLQPATENQKHFATPFSWGYRLVARGEINNAIGAITLQPTIAFNHDVSGITPAPISNFLEDRKSLTVGLGAQYLNRLQAGVAYTVNFGAGRYNLLKDRDFVSMALSYSF